MSMEFFLGFPKTMNGFDTICVVVDRFSKMTHFLPCKTSNDASSIARFFFKEIVRLQGLPLTIVSDKDSKFIGHFWRSLWKSLGTNLAILMQEHHGRRVIPLNLLVPNGVLGVFNVYSM